MAGLYSQHQAMHINFSYIHIKHTHSHTKAGTSSVKQRSNTMYSINVIWHPTFIMTFQLNSFESNKTALFLNQIICSFTHEQYNRNSFSTEHGHIRKNKSIIHYKSSFHPHCLFLLCQYNGTCISLHCKTYISLISLSDTHMTENPLRYTDTNTLLQKMNTVPFLLCSQACGTVPVGNPVGVVLGAHSVSITLTAAA